MEMLMRLQDEEMVENKIKKEQLSMSIMFEKKSI